MKKYNVLTFKLLGEKSNPGINQIHGTIYLITVIVASISLIVYNVMAVISPRVFDTSRCDPCITTDLADNSLRHLHRSSSSSTREIVMDEEQHPLQYT